jgi:signal transduction histidine kinase
VLNAFDKLGGGEFAPEDERLLEAFAASAATAIATAQDVANRELRRSIEATENERRRWARELHDETLQDLAAVRLLLGALKGGEELGDGARRQLDQALEQLTVSISGLRRLIADLRPAALDALGVGPALDAFAARLAPVGSVEVVLDVRLAYEDGRTATRLSPAVEETIYRLVQEAINNAIKHAEATRTEVTLLEDEHVVTITVTDDGRGFDPDRSDEGFGLVGMRERAALVGGTLEIRSALGAGTMVRAVLPARRRDIGPAVTGRTEAG